MRRVPPRLTDASGPAYEPVKALAALDDWLVEPLSPASTGVETKTALTKKVARPWDTLDPNRQHPLNADIPAVLHAKLRWVAQSTYGMTMKKVIVQALEEAVEKALKEMGDGG